MLLPGIGRSPGSPHAPVVGEGSGLFYHPAEINVLASHSDFSDTTPSGDRRVETPLYSLARVEL